MYNTSHSIASNLLLTVVVALLFGLIIGYPGWTLSLALLGWALYQVKQFNRLQQWLMSSKPDDVPEGEGHWGELFDEISRDQKRQQQRSQTLRNVIHRFRQSSAALSDAIVIINGQSYLEWWNRAAEQLLGMKVQTDRGRSVINLLRDPRFVRYYHKGNYEDPLQLASPLDNNVILEYRITRFGAGDRILVARDITRLKQLEQTRQDFVANASHELRTPLTVIRGYLETFLDQNLPRPLQRGLSQMENQSRRMENLVSDLLLLSRLEASSHLSDELPVPVHSIIGRIREDALVLGQEKQQQIQLELEPENTLLGQEAEVYSAFSNLVFNAVRYTQAGGNIKIRWWTDKQGAHFSVKDNGPGIDSLHLPRLQERFYRVDESRSSDSGGTGLGLAIVKHVMLRHGGKLSIKSQPGKGSTFTCHFPLELMASVTRPEETEEE
ncbi:phosphate regulon sensor histidine kinase PhoR [Amphritea balenae]|uniref:Phosphate regulon sensor protein PhoR n=1 Tax=Amphritea balenae TaxID=452629 RepID=A0A3P1SNH1_9GAMM|nr:phosphate regulon sensor histidine kinase PhoR [Amphritea balenae]RRC98801.1 phosphate regulon sensor histidine kinase PhoR [Amphritea balenae]GGK61834.1 phosphate regulon sensor protein PhoR [Amphritea balenae]